MERVKQPPFLQKLIDLFRCLLLLKGLWLGLLLLHLKLILFFILIIRLKSKTQLRMLIISSLQEIESESD